MTALVADGGPSSKPSTSRLAKRCRRWYNIASWRKLLKHFRQFVRAQTEDEAIDLKKAVGPKSLYIAGGTTVVLFASKSVEVLIDISRLGLGGVEDKAGVVTIGSTTRLSSLLGPEVRSALPMFSEALSVCATPQIRNMATLGGSLAGIRLPSDAGVALAALGTELDLGGDHKRVVAIEDLLSGGWLDHNDLIRSVRVKKLGPHEGWGFCKFGRSDVDVALVNVAAVVGVGKGSSITSLKVAVGQTFSMPVVLTDLLPSGGGPISHDLIGTIADSAADRVKVRSDFRASSAYRKQLVRTLTARSIVAAVERAGARLED
jgi:CO/xanthine dehydrogenase FAD-binding subunit